MKVSEVEGILEAIHDLREDNTVPKNLKNKLGNVTNILKEDTELSIKINKALNELEDVSDDVNLQPYVRTQIWNIVSMLETVQVE
jgi:uncharacterized protein (UPF0147 family)